MRTVFLLYVLSGCTLIAGFAGAGCTAEPDPAYYHEGPLAGSLKSDRPLPIFDADPNHLWNRLFATLYMRPSNLPDAPDGKPIKRIEGGDVIDFLGWAKTTYWSQPAVAQKLDRLLAEYLEHGGSGMVQDPLRRAVFLRDLWAAYDYLVGQNIRRAGSLDVRRRRDEICRKLASVIQTLALPRRAISALPDNYAAALASGRFTTSGRLDPQHDYLPAGLLTQPHEWVEIDFFQPDLHGDLSARFIALHTRSYRARSYFRIFYRFPKGREQLADYLKRLETAGVNWRQAAQEGFILLKDDSPQIPLGTEVALVQFMMTLDAQLRPVPTRIVESIRMRSYESTDGSDSGATNTGVGMNVMEYTLKRRLLFNDLCAGGLQREPDGTAVYRVLFQGDNDPDWGRDQRMVLFQQCINCHMTPKLNRTGVRSFFSIVHMGGFDAGAQLGIAAPLEAGAADVHGKRAAKWKRRHETYRRLLEHLGR